MVGDAGIRKVIHLVVQYYPRGRREYLVAKARKGISQVTGTELPTEHQVTHKFTTRLLPERSWYNHFLQQIDGAGDCDRVAVGTDD